MCIEREKVDFKSREVNCLKECALALNFSNTMSVVFGVISTILLLVIRVMFRSLVNEDTLCICKIRNAYLKESLLV